MKIIIKLRNSIREFVVTCHKIWLTKLMGMNIDSSAKISFGARLDRTNPTGIHIGKESYIASGAIIFSHDFSRGLHMDTYIGSRCFIGSYAIVMCGVKIGDSCIVGSGAIVTRDVPSNSIVVGNPARIIRQGITTGKFGQLVRENE